MTQDEVNETISNLQVKPMNHSLFVLIPTVADETHSGIIKSDGMIEKERKQIAEEALLTVVAVADDVTADIKPGDRVYVQGSIVTFASDVVPEEFDVAPEGYELGLTLDMYIKAKISR